MRQACSHYPMKTKRNRAAVISAPRDAGDSIPSIANTKNSITQFNQCILLHQTSSPHIVFFRAELSGKLEELPTGISKSQISQLQILKNLATKILVWLFDTFLAHIFVMYVSC